MKYKPNLAEAVERMRRLWALEPPLDRVPCILSVPRPAGASGERPRDGTFFGDLDGYMAYQDVRFERQSHVPDEHIPTAHPQYGHALISALCGSPAEHGSETVWSVPIIEDWAQVDALRLDFDSDWGVHYQADLERLFDWAHDRCAVSIYEVEGISDTMSALRDAERLLYDMADVPETIHHFARRVTDILIEWGRWQHEHVAPKQQLMGGVSTGWCVWMPKGSIAMAEDATVMISPTQYREFIQPEERRLTDAFTHALIEVHQQGNHQIAPFGEVDGLSMLSLENLTTMTPEQREAVRALLGRKCFQVMCKPEEIEDVLAFTGTVGIFLRVGVRSVEEACELLAHIERLTRAHGPASA